jgi:hypothetical protein
LCILKNRRNISIARGRTKSKQRYPHAERVFMNTFLVYGKVAVFNRDSRALILKLSEGLPLNADEDDRQNTAFFDMLKQHNTDGMKTPLNGSELTCKATSAYTRRGYGDYEDDVHDVYKSKERNARLECAVQSQEQFFFVVMLEKYDFKGHQGYYCVYVDINDVGRLYGNSVQMPNRKEYYELMVGNTKQLKKWRRSGALLLAQRELKQCEKYIEKYTTLLADHTKRYTALKAGILKATNGQN